LKLLENDEIELTEPKRGYITSSNPATWNYMDASITHYTVATNGKKFVFIKANSSNQAGIIFTKTDVEPTQHQQEIANRSEYYNIRLDIPAGEGVVIPVPSDANYVILNAAVGSTIWKPEIFALSDFSDEVNATKIELENDGSLLNNSVGENCFANGVRNNLKILCYGNSFMLNTAYYISSIAKGCGVNLIVGDLYTGGTNLGSHISALRNNSAVYGWRKWIDGVQTINTSNVAPMTALLNEHWDAIIVHQYKPWVEPYQPNLNIFINMIVEKIGYCPKIYVNSTWGKHKDVVLERDGFETEEAMWEAMLDECKAACTKAGIKEFNIIPVGTAIQNARTLPWTDIDTTYNRFCELYDNDGVSTDKSHLNGAGGFIAAATVYQKIVAPLNGVSCLNTTFRITEPVALPPQVTPMNTPVTDDNYQDLCNAVIAAVNNPSIITDMSE
jgi:hypothetical protein